jgi:hypothetical protein
VVIRRRWLGLRPEEGEEGAGLDWAERRRYRFGLAGRPSSREGEGRPRGGEGRWARRGWWPSARGGGSGPTWRGRRSGACWAGSRWPGPNAKWAGKAVWPGWKLLRGGRKEKGDCDGWAELIFGPKGFWVSELFLKFKSRFSVYKSKVLNIFKLKLNYIQTRIKFK